MKKYIWCTRFRQVSPFWPYSTAILFPCVWWNSNDIDAYRWRQCCWCMYVLGICCQYRCKHFIAWRMPVVQIPVGGSHYLSRQFTEYMISHEYSWVVERMTSRLTSHFKCMGCHMFSTILSSGSLRDARAIVAYGKDSPGWVMPYSANRQRITSTRTWHWVGIKPSVNSLILITIFDSVIYLDIQRLTCNNVKVVMGWLDISIICISQWDDCQHSS